MTKRACNHPPLSHFQAFKSNAGRVVWRCSHCGKEDIWGDGWKYFGPIECRCGATGVRAVVCSDKCAADFKPSDPALALDLAKHREGSGVLDG